MRRKRAVLALILALPVPSLFAQGGRAGEVNKTSKTAANSSTKPLDPRKRFAYDVVRSAVALPANEPQDRLRVLAAAAAVIAPIRPSLARAYSREGILIEQDLIQRGERPSASMLSSGPVDCKAVRAFVENIAPQHVDAAETSLVAAIGACPGVSASAEQLIDAGLGEKKAAPRATLALMERAGVHSAWAQDKFEKLFDTLPSDAENLQTEAPNFAAVYARFARTVDASAAKSAGIRFLLWLGKLPESGDRTMAVNVSTGAMKQALGEQGYEDALAGDVMARQVAQTAGGNGEISQPMDSSVSVLKAMQSSTQDRLQELESLPPSQRAREAAASGFASGTSGDTRLSARYFDLAFSSLNAVWSERGSTRDATAVVREVSEAAAQVNSIDALQRARGLDDTPAQAIGMISVARVVANKDQPTPTSASR